MCTVTIQAKVQLYKPPELLPDGKPSELKPKYSEPWDFIYFPAKAVQDKHSRCIGNWNETLCQCTKKEESSKSTSKTPMYTLTSAADLGHITVPKQIKKRPHPLVEHGGNTDPDLNSGRNVDKKEKEATTNTTTNVNTGKILEEVLVMEDEKNCNKSK